MMEELLSRLRKHRYNTWNDDLGPDPDKAEAADRIQQLLEERQALAMRDAGYDVFTKLNATVERLRFCLQEIVEAHSKEAGEIDRRLALKDAQNLLKELK